MRGPRPGLFAGVLVATYIALEAPYSGMSMNPARSLASAVPGQALGWVWIYFVAPPIGMLLAAETYRALGGHPVRCAKMHHDHRSRCIFRCGYREPGPSQTDTVHHPAPVAAMAACAEIS